jgi:hypothetical protein
MPPTSAPCHSGRATSTARTPSGSSPIRSVTPSASAPAEVARVPCAGR